MVIQAIKFGWLVDK